MKISWIRKVFGFGISLGLGLLCGTQQANATGRVSERVSGRATHADAPAGITSGCILVSGSNDFRGSFAASSSVLGCTITFNTAFSVAPVCVVAEQSTLNGYVSVGTPTTTTLSIGWQSAFARSFYYSCTI